MPVRSYVSAFALLCGVVIFSGVAVGQAITNSGTEFWFGITEPVDQQASVYQVNISGREAASGTVSITGGGFSQNFNVVPGSVTKITLPSNLAWISSSEVLEPRAIHVVADKEVVVYTNTYHMFRSEASLVLPNRALGNSYAVTTGYSIVKTYLGNPGTWVPELMVVAAGEEVTVDITPTCNTRGGNLAGNTFQVTLDSGDLYQVKADSFNDDLTGTIITATDPDKKFSVFAGNEWSRIYCGENADPQYEAMFPIASWGREYIMIPTPNVGVDMYRVLAVEDDTDVFKDGVLMTTLDAGEFYQDTHMVPRIITANNPISVAQFMVGTGAGTCSNSFEGDPSMLMINSNEQMFLDSITFFAVSEFNINLNYVVIVTRTPDTATMELNGNLVTGYNILQGDSDYAYTVVSIDTGSHNLFSSGCGFLAYSIGLGQAESYSYAAGVLLTDLTQGITYTNVSFNSDTICLGDSLQFSSSTSGDPQAWNWDFGDGSTSMVANPIHLYDSAKTYFVSLIIDYGCRFDTVYDTLTVLNLPVVNLSADTVVCLEDTLVIDADSVALTYEWEGGETTQKITVDSTGWYTVTVSNGRCFDTDSIYVEFRPTVTGMSFGSIDTADTICDGDILQFVGSTTREVLYWNWSFGDGVTDTAQATTHAYPAGGDYTVGLTTAYLCGMDTIVDQFDGTVRIWQTPDASLGGDTFICEQSFRLRVDQSSLGYNLLWFPSGETDTAITITEPGTYALFAENRGCTDSDTIQVEFSTEFLIPNVITPNGDGVNDFFRVFTTRECHDFDDMKVYNRWGELVFHTRSPLTISWDGTTSFGNKVEPGVYYFILDGEDGHFTGSLSVLRQ